MEKIMNGYRALKEIFADGKISERELPAFFAACADIAAGIGELLSGFLSMKGKGKLVDVADAFKLAARK